MGTTDGDVHFPHSFTAGDIPHQWLAVMVHTASISTPDLDVTTFMNIIMLSDYRKDHIRRKFKNIEYHPSRKYHGHIVTYTLFCSRYTDRRIRMPQLRICKGAVLPCHLRHVSGAMENTLSHPAASSPLYRMDSRLLRPACTESILSQLKCLRRYALLRTCLRRRHPRTIFPCHVHFFSLRDGDSALLAAASVRGVFAYFS